MLFQLSVFARLKFDSYQQRNIPAKLVDWARYRYRVSQYQDERFSKDNFYLFMASTFVEQEQLEKQINISGRKGASKTNTSGETVVKLLDLFSVFQPIKGTPKYWQTAKYELVAKVKQLGPFHLFYTFSCGEMR